MRDIQLRSAGPDDAERLSFLFREAYRSSSHPCKDPSFLRQSLASGDRWILALDGDRIAGCTAGVWNAWNRVYETGRTVASPEHRGAGLGQRLVELCYRDLYSRPDCELTVGFPRSVVMLRVAQKDPNAPFVVTGHDGGINVANGQREFHLLGLTRNPRRGVRHVAAPPAAIREVEEVAGSVVQALGLETDHGPYPATAITGPRGDRQARIGAWSIRYDWNPECPSRSLQLTAADGPTGDGASLVGALETLLRRHPEAEHVHAFVLADKRRLSEEMQRVGFRVTAYLPAWHHERGRRYDCLMLARRTGIQEPVTHGTGEIVNHFEMGLNPTLVPAGAIDRAA